MTIKMKLQVVNDFKDGFSLDTIAVMLYKQGIREDDLGAAIEKAVRDFMNGKLKGKKRK